MTYRLTIDNREPEQMISQATNACMLSGWLNHTLDNNDTSDFILSQQLDGNEYVLAVFERKTWNDLAASIKDGRCSSQTSRLDILRSKGIKVYFVIEGHLPPSDGAIGGMLIKCLYGYLDSLSAREFCILHTRDEGHTSERILNVCKHVVESKPKLYTSCTELYVDRLRSCPIEVAQSLQDDIKILVDKYRGRTTQDQIRIDPDTTTVGIASNMWRTLVGDKVSKALMMNFSIKDVYDDPSIVKGIYFDTGKRVPDKMLAKVRSSIRDPSTILEMLKVIRGAGASSSAFIEQLGIDQLMSITSAPVVKHNGRNLNKNILPQFIDAIRYSMLDT